MDPPAPTQPVALAGGERPVPSGRRLAAASVSPNTRRAYSGALRRLDAWLAGRALYLAELHEQGRAPSSASTAVAAARFRARLAGEPSPAGERTARVLAGYRRTAGERGRGQARPFGASDLAAVLATCERPRRRGRGVESAEVAVERGRLDAVIARLLYSRPIECTDRDAPFVLDGVLYHESDLDLEENGARLEGHMATLDTHAIARTLTDAGADPKLADAITAAVREAADHGDHVTPDQFKAGLAEMEARLTWRFAGAMLAQTGVILAAVIGAAVAILRMLG